MQKKLSLFVLSGCIFLGGCVYTRSLPLYCKVDKPSEKVHQFKKSPKIFVTVIDKRSVSDPRTFIGQISNRKMIYKAEKPMADIMKSAIEDGFRQMNFKIIETDSSKYILSCKINSIKSDFTGGNVPMSFIVKMSVQCNLMNKKNRKILWQDMVATEGKTDSWWYISSDDMGHTFCSALADLVREIQSSETLQMSVNHIAR